MSMRIEEFQKRWGALTENQRARVRAKARWEHMSLTAVLREWPGGWEDSPIDPVGCACGYVGGHPQCPTCGERKRHG